MYACVCIYIYMYVYIYIYIYICMGAALFPPLIFDRRMFSPKPKVVQFTTLCEHLVSYMSQKKHLVNYMDLVEQRKLGIEPGTSCIRGPTLTN